jgi:triosephosphate isomerase
LVSDPANYGDWSDRTGASYEVYNVDEDVLKAMVRSNPGMLLLHKGVLLGKWGTNDIPETSDVAQLIELNSREISSDFGERIVWIRLLLLLGAPLLLLIALDGLWIGQKYRGHRIRMRELLQQKSNIG